MMTLAKMVRLSSVLLSILLLGCQMSIEPNEPFRCFEDLSLTALIETIGQPQDQPGGRTSTSEEGMTSDGVFDSLHYANLFLDRPAPFVAALCEELVSQLSSRCQVNELWSGGSHCFAQVESPESAITGPLGIYTHGRMEGRVNLFAASALDGRVGLVLSAFEWPG